MNTNDMLARAAQLSDQALLAQVQDLAQREREATVALIVHLAELDERRLYLAEGYSSLFKYCTDVLHLAEHAAYNRIEAARAVRRFPVLLEHLAAGWLTLSAVRLLAPHLTPENHRDVLARARHKSKRETEELVARLRPQPPVPDVVRKLPTRTEATSPAALRAGTQDPQSTPRDHDAGELLLAVAPAAMAASARRAVVSPLAPEQYRVQFTAGAELCAKLREAQALLRHQVPDGDLEQIFNQALNALLANLRKKKHAATARPREDQAQGSEVESNSTQNSRHISAAVRRAVWARDGGRCAFMSPNGRQCGEEAFLEFHHVVPYAKGGPCTVDNIELRCRAHNGYEAEAHFGRWGATAVREEHVAYAPAASAVSDATLLGHRPSNSFWNEFPRQLREEWQTAKCREDAQGRSDPHVSLSSHVSLTMVGM